jgi:hypothetical protein
MKTNKYFFNNPVMWIYTAYLLFKIIQIIFVPPAAIRGLGDITHFFRLSEIPGWPYIDYWVEFPPIAPFLFKLLYLIARGIEDKFTILFFGFISLVNLINIRMFSLVDQKINPLEEKTRNFKLFFLTILFLIFPYTWWYFDSLAVFFLLCTLYLYQVNKYQLGTITLSLGVLTKLFPVFGSVILFKRIGIRKTLILAIFGLVIVSIPILILVLVSQDFALASLASQISKGSWETIWALIDGNYQTGNFGPLWERLEPQMAFITTFQPAKIPSLSVLIPFLVIGFLLIRRSQIKRTTAEIPLILSTFLLFFLWSPGWSPQWVLFLIPLILLSPGQSLRLQMVIVVFLVFLALSEWPIIIGLQIESLFPVIILLRTGFMVLLLISNAKEILSKEVITE